MAMDRVTVEGTQSFVEEGTMLVAQKKDIGNFNEEGLRRLQQPICHIKSRNNSAEAAKAKPHEADNLYANMFLYKGAKVVLTRNLRSEAGLVNGSQGTVQYIVYAEGNTASASTWCWSTSQATVEETSWMTSQTLCQFSDLWLFGTTGEMK